VDSGKRYCKPVGMSFYMIINSNKNLDIYPHNRPHKFRTYLQTPITLKSKWKVALVDIKLSATNDLYIYSNICGDTIVDGNKQPLLRRICCSSQTDHYQFDQLTYIPVTKSELRDIEFFITDEQGNQASFLKNQVSITLHFRSYPYFA